MELTRRELLGSLGGLAIGAAIGGVGTRQVFGATKEEAPALPWPYKKLDPKAAAAAAYEGYGKAGCCYGAFLGVIDGLAKKVGAPYTTIPTELWIVGEGGMAGTGNLCGALNGAAYAIFLTAGGMEKEKREEAFAIIQDLFHWYEQTKLPIYTPKKAILYDGKIVKSISGSTLCHVSVTNWCKVSGFKSFSAARSERCGRLTADVVAHTVELLNKDFAGAFKRGFALSAAAQGCRDCHDKGSELENTRGIMECGQCHFNLGTKHPEVK